jgi:hypothetical protein
MLKTALANADHPREFVKQVQASADLRELVFEEISTQLMDITNPRPFKKPASCTHLSQLDLFCMMSLHLVPNDAKHEGLKKALAACIGAEQPIEVKAILDKEEYKKLLPQKVKDKLFKSPLTTTLARFTQLINTK